MKNFRVGFEYWFEIGYELVPTVEYDFFKAETEEEAIKQLFELNKSLLITKAWIE